MVTSAYCSGCGRRVELDDAGQCPRDHLRSMLRDVREGVAAPAPTAEKPAAVASAATAVATSSGLSSSHEFWSVVIGRSVVIVPVALVIAFGLWTGYESAVGTKMTPLMAALTSIGSLAMSVGTAFVWARMKGRKS